MENVGPVANGRIHGPGAADQVDAGGEGRGVLRPRRRPGISVAMGQEPVMVQPPRIMPESKASQPSVVLWAKTTDPTPSSFRIRRPSVKAFAMPSSKNC